MNITKLTITGYDAVPSIIKNSVKYTTVNPDIEIAGKLIKDKLYLTDDVVEISAKATQLASKKRNSQVFTPTGNESDFYQAKYQIENSIAYMNKK